MIAPLLKAELRRLTWIAHRFAETDCLTIAGSLAFTSMLALVPVMTVVYVGLAYLPQFAALAADVEAFIFANLVPNSSAQIQAKLGEFAARAGNLTAVGLGSLVVTALMLLLSIERHFNAIWHLQTPSWGIGRTVLLVGLLTVGPSLLLAGIWISTYVLSLPLIADVGQFGPSSQLLGYLPIVCLFLVFSLLFKVIPNTQVLWSSALTGGLLTAAVFKLAFALFAWVSQYFVYGAIYGALAVLPAFLIWLFLVWVILLLGAVFVCSLQQPESTDQAPATPANRHG